MKVYESKDLGVEYKKDNSPLTLADKKCNDVINSFLQETPIPIISEENKQIDFQDRKGWEEDLLCGCLWTRQTQVDQSRDSDKRKGSEEEA